MKILVRAFGATPAVDYIGPSAEIVGGRININYDSLPEVEYTVVDVADDTVPADWVRGKYLYKNGFALNAEFDEVTRLKVQLAEKTAELEKSRQDMADQTAAILDIYDIIGGM
jgi:hypothetical protein